MARPGTITFPCCATSGKALTLPLLLRSESAPRVGERNKISKNDSSAVFVPCFSITGVLRDSCWIRKVVVLPPLRGSFHLCVSESSSNGILITSLSIIRTGQSKVYITQSSVLDPNNGWRRVSYFLIVSYGSATKGNRCLEKRIKWATLDLWHVLMDKTEPLLVPSWVVKWGK